MKNRLLAILNQRVILRVDAPLGDLVLAALVVLYLLLAGAWLIWQALHDFRQFLYSALIGTCLLLAHRRLMGYLRRRRRRRTPPLPSDAPDDSSPEP